MSTMRRPRPSPLVASWALLVVVASACSSGVRDAPSPADATIPPVATPASSPPTLPAAGPALTGCGSSTVSIDYVPGLTTADLAAHGAEFVVANVVGFEPAIFNTPDGHPRPGFPRPPADPRPNGNAGDMIYTPINVDIERSINGQWSRGLSHFLVEGGTAAVDYVIDGQAIHCYEFRVAPVPQVAPGSRYVFILSEALDDGGVDPLPQPRALFAWPFNEFGSVSTFDGLMSLERLTEVVLEAAPSPEPGATAATG